MTTLQLLLLILATALQITAIHVLFWEGMLLHKLAQWLSAPRTVDSKYVGSIIQVHRPRAAQWITKPLFECLTCMSSFWGLLYWFANGNALSMQLIPYLLTLCGINAIIDIYIGRIKTDNEIQ